MRFASLLVLLFCVSSLMAADPPAKEPAELAQAKLALENDLTIAKTAYDRETATARKLFVAKLEKLQKELTTKGNLEGALAVKTAKEGAGSAEPAAAWSPVETVWTRQNGQLTFRRDGIVVTADGGWEKRGLVTSWKLIGPRAILLHIDRGRDSQLAEVWLLDATAKNYVGWDFEGRPMQGTRVR